MQEQVVHFLQRHWNPARGVLLGLSGGPDSLALLYLALPFVTEKGMRLHLAHVDHGWRPESTAEADQLAQLAERLGLPFHRTRLTDAQRQGHLEASGRAARLDFFAQLCEQYGCQAVLLGHQADDVVETTLKRVLEGVTLPYLNGLQPVVRLDRLTLWRPLLTVSKNALVAWLQKQGLQPFDDVTNRDARFLRGRMRTRLLPLLTQHFGKTVSSGLLRIAGDAQELRDYLDQRIAMWLQRLIVGPLGWALSLVEDFPTSIYELRYLVRRVIELAGFFVSREILDCLVRALEDNAADTQAQMGEQRLVVDRRRLFIITRFLPAPKELLKLALGTIYMPPWEITTTSVRWAGGEAQAGWQHLWRGEAVIFLQPGEYQTGLPQASARCAIGGQETRLSRWWSNHKVPAFLRQQVPVIWAGPLVCGELLTGRGHRLGVGTDALRVSCRLLSNPTCDTISLKTTDSDFRPL
jgi:tRNA(Ile)-lysidine synthase